MFVPIADFRHGCSIYSVPWHCSVISRGNLGRWPRSWEYVSQVLWISSTSFSVYFCQYSTTEQPWVLICGDCVTIGFFFLIAVQFWGNYLVFLYFFTSFAECFHTLWLLEVQKVLKQCLSWVNSEKLPIIFVKILLFRFPQIKYKDKVTYFFLMKILSCLLFMKLFENWKHTA